MTKVGRVHAVKPLSMTCPFGHGWFPLNSGHIAALTGSGEARSRRGHRTLAHRPLGGAPPSRAGWRWCRGALGPSAPGGSRPSGARAWASCGSRWRWPEGGASSLVVFTPNRVVWNLRRERPAALDQADAPASRLMALHCHAARSREAAVALFDFRLVRSNVPNAFAERRGVIAPICGYPCGELGCRERRAVRGSSPRSMPRPGALARGSA